MMVVAELHRLQLRRHMEAVARPQLTQISFARFVRTISTKRIRSGGIPALVGVRDRFEQGLFSLS